jgi:DNA ligase-1
MIGALIVETPDGTRFSIGSGLSDADRIDPPRIGTWVTYRYQTLTAHGVPRFARYVRVNAGENKENELSHRDHGAHGAIDRNR